MQKFNRSCPLFDERVEILQQMSPSTGASHAGAAIAGSNDSLVRITIRILQGTQVRKEPSSLYLLCYIQNVLS